MHGGLTIFDNWIFSSDRVLRDVDLLRNFTKDSSEISPVCIKSVGTSRHYIIMVTRTFSEMFNVHSQEIGHMRRYDTSILWPSPKI